MSESTRWQSSGLCASLAMGEPLWMSFFGEDDVDRRPALAMCRQCPVVEQCLRTALEKKEIWGVWGACDERTLQRTLWVNNVGSPTAHAQHPSCPRCSGPSSSLTVSMICDMTTRRRRERVTCSRCDFHWHSSSSAAGVRAYWRERQKRLRARSVASVKIGNVTPIASSTPRAMPQQDTQVALAASVRPAETQF